MKLRVAGCVLVALALGACGEAKEGPPPRPTATPTLAAPTGTPTGGRTAIDALGRAVLIPEDVRTVVVLSTTAAQFAVALNLEVIGRTTDTTEPTLAGVAEVGSSLSPDFNAMNALAPDLVIGDAAFQAGRTRDFDRFPHPVYAIAVARYDDILETLASLGEVLGREELATAEAERIEGAVEDILEDIGQRTGPGVLVVSGSGRDVYGASTATYIGSLLELLGATNVYGETAEGAPLPGFGVIEISEGSPELRAATDVILVMPGGQGDPAAGVIAASGFWRESAVVTGGRLHELDPELFLRAPGLRVVEALEVLAALLYP